MSRWIDVGSRHRVQLLPTATPDVVTLLWEHDTPTSYQVRRHMVSSAAGASWTVVSADPLTLQPSLHCDPSRGGCGAHSFITGGRWS